MFEGSTFYVNGDVDFTHRVMVYNIWLTGNWGHVRENYILFKWTTGLNIAH